MIDFKVGDRVRVKDDAFVGALAFHNGVTGTVASIYPSGGLKVDRDEPFTDRGEPSGETWTVYSPSLVEHLPDDPGHPFSVEATINVSHASYNTEADVEAEVYIVSPGHGATIKGDPADVSAALRDAADQLDRLAQKVV